MSKYNSGITVELMSHTQYPKELIYCVWQRSRDPNFKMTPYDVLNESDFDERIMGPEECEKACALGMEVDKLFRQLIDTHLPVAEMIEFTFWLDGIPISLREQLVRHRIGTKVNGVPDVDVFPDQADSTWWAQGMRVMDMATFVDEGRYHTPESIDDTKLYDQRACGTRRQVFNAAMRHAQEAYVDLVESGVPREDARQVIPLGATHGLAWKLNLAALKHIIGHRSCWILQIGLWEDVLRGMIDELATKIDPYFRCLINPPCIKGDEFTGCVFKVDNHRRITGEDEPPPCSLYMAKHYEDACTAAFVPKGATRNWVPDRDTRQLLPVSRQIEERYEGQREKYRQLWGRDPDTGLRLDAPTGPAEQPGAPA